MSAGGFGPPLSFSCRESRPKEPEATTTPLPNPNAPETLDKPYVVLVSFDGFRHDYLTRYDTPSFDHVASAGGAADALIPAAFSES